MPVKRFHTIVNEGECTILGNLNFKYCLPIKRDCTPTNLNWILTECGEGWCERKEPQDMDYFQPFIAGDLIQFELLMDDNYNPDPLSPAAGWNEWVQLKIVTPQGTISGSETDPYITRKMVAVKDGNSYQVIEIDTQALADDDITCWKITVEAYNSEAEISEVICSETFKEINCNDPSILIKGVFDTYDCLGNYYGEPDYYLGDLIKYDNTMRFRGYLWDDKTNSKTETVVNNVKSVELTENWLLVIADALPTNIEKLLYLQLTAGKELYIDNEQYLKGSFESEKLEYCNMYKCEIPVYRQCKSGNNC